MGAWNTLHLFDSDNFYEHGVPCLKGKTRDFRDDYSDFLASFRIRGTSNLSSEALEDLLTKSVLSIQETSNKFNPEFKQHAEYDTISSWDDRRNYLNKQEQYYEFGQFFEHYMFKYYTDFYPHINCGKHGLHAKLGIQPNSVVDEIIGNLEDADNYFCPDGRGIVSWISKEDTRILLECKHDCAPKEAYQSLFNTFFDLVNIACDHQLGLIRGVDLKETQLHELAKFKLIPENKWHSYDFEGIFDIYKSY